MSLLLARLLEDGRLQGAAATGLARLWAAAAARGIARPLARPLGVRIVAVGGATLGGSGATPLAIEAAAELARRGESVAFVGHAYRARPAHARQVSSADPVGVVGDEALVAAARLAPLGVPVFVGPDRASAVAAAARRATLVVVDGLVQAAPRVDLALLAVDATHPWGRAAAVPPLGDLRAPRAALVRATDRVVRVGDGSPDAAPRSRGAWRDGQLLDWTALSRLRVGLAVALARPERLLAFLATRGVVPAAVVRAPDHGPLPMRRRWPWPAPAPTPAVDVWLATAKCAVHWPRAVPAPAVVEQALELSPELVAALRRLARS